MNLMERNFYQQPSQFPQQYPQFSSQPSNFGTHGNIFLPSGFNYQQQQQPLYSLPIQEKPTRKRVRSNDDLTFEEDDNKRIGKKVHWNLDENPFSQIQPQTQSFQPSYNNSNNSNSNDNVNNEMAIENSSPKKKFQEEKELKTLQNIDNVQVVLNPSFFEVPDVSIPKSMLEATR